MSDSKIFYNYGQFKNLEINEEIAEKDFYNDKLQIYRILCDSKDIIKVENEQVLNIKIKIKLKESSKSLINEVLDALMKKCGISYKYIDNNEKQKLYKLDFTLESVRNYAKNYHTKYIEECKQKLPPEIHICLKDICFTYYNHLFGYPVITINNYIKNIREYFILERFKNIFEEYRDNEVFNEIKEEMIDLYPVLKEKYVNKYFDKFLSFLDPDNDYNIEEIKAILDNYSTLKQNEYTKLKRKED